MFSGTLYIDANNFPGELLDGEIGVIEGLHLKLKSSVTNCKQLGVILPASLGNFSILPGVVFEGTDEDPKLGSVGYLQLTAFLPDNRRVSIVVDRNDRAYLSL